MKRLSKVLILMGILFPVQVFALGLGELQTQSALNQPFLAELQILRASPAELKGLQVRLASEEDYARIGLERLPILNALNFMIVKKGSSHYIRISSRRQISEPYLNFLIEVNWARGRMLREFTVLLDPPELLGSGAPDLTAPEAETSISEEAESMAAEIPVSEVVSAAVSESSLVYGPVERNEKLWNIAKQIRGEHKASIPQVMMALLRNNPEAFIRENVNNLKQGYVLRIENPKDIYEMDAQEARLAFQHQYQLWHDYKQSRAKAAKERTESAKTDREQRSATTKDTAVSSDGVLTLERPKSKEPVAGHLESSQPGNGQQNEQISKLRDDLAAAEENAELSEKRNEEMHERLKAMEDQIASLQRLMQIKSDELVALQETQKEAPESTDLMEADSSEQEYQIPAVLKELQKNPQLMGIIGGAILLILAMFWVLARKRRGADKYGYQFSSEQTGVSSDYDEPDYGVSSPRTIEEDPLTQADIFVAYGNLDAAVNLMSSAVEKQPGNAAYQNKLDDLTSMLTKRDGDMHAAPINSDEVIPEEEIFEEETLLTSDDLAAFQQEFEDNQKEAAPKIDLSEARLSLVDDAAKFEALLDAGDSPETSVPDSDGIDFDLSDLDDEIQELTTDKDVDLSTDSSVLEFNLDELDDILEVPEKDSTDLDASINNVLDDDNSAPEIDLSAIADDASAEDIDASIDSTLDEVLDDVSTDINEDGLIEIGDHEPDLLNSVDEVGTKLDLARAYIDMGDPEGARSILDEVLLEGNPDQISQAHELLDQI